MLVLFFEVGNNVRAALLQIGDVPIAIKRHASLPNTKKYSNPAACYLSDGGVMLHAAVAKHVVSGLAPLLHGQYRRAQSANSWKVCRKYLGQA